MKNRLLVKLLLGLSIAIVPPSIFISPVSAQSPVKSSPKSALMRAENELVRAKEQSDRIQILYQQGGISDFQLAQLFHTYLTTMELRNQKLIIFYESNGKEDELKKVQSSIERAKEIYSRVELLAKEGAISPLQVLSALDRYHAALNQQWRIILENARARSSSPQKVELADLELRLADLELRLANARRKYESMTYLASEGAIPKNSVVEAKKNYEMLKKEHDRLIQQRNAIFLIQGL